MPDAPILKISQASGDDDRHTIRLAWLCDGISEEAEAQIAFAVSEEDQQDIRWYVEEYAEYPFDPNPQRAARVEARMREIGQALFNKLFRANEATSDLWASIAGRLDDMRIEVITDAEGATALPWELLRQPATDTPLALHARAFVRAPTKASRRPLALAQGQSIRILLVICRPAGDKDVPFRSVAARLLKSLSAEARQVFQLDVLRPPTFARLAQALDAARAAGNPYHVVHFDGHGAYGLRAALLQAEGVMATKYRAEGPQGFLLFEGAAPEERLVHGTQLGDLLVKHDVPLLVLNACRSAHAERPDDEAEAEPAAGAAPAAGDNPYARVRAFGSLAQQVMLQGVGGVVAMRYNVYVVTAAQFVAELYAALVQGRPLAEAVTRGRQNLAAQPVREIVQKVALQDWLVPVVYEARATQVFAPPPARLQLTIAMRPAEATPARGMIDQGLPAEPDAGFFGRDETLLALDRGFDQHQVVLLQAYAGGGKTTAAAEFARWYALTGGVEGPVLFTAFTQRRTLGQALDQLGMMFNQSLQQSGIDWQALTDEAVKRDLALQILRQVPVLWVWDNVEPVAGFPAGTPSAWTEDEQRGLADFLRAARGTKAKFLLTSRRAERGWLGDLPLRVVLPPMPMHERRQLAEALAAKYRVTFEQDDWKPLLYYSEGNPLTLTVVVGQALRDGLRTAAQIRQYVQQLRAGQAVFDDDADEGRSKSLGASLSYGFGTSFSDQERATLALLHHFQGFVDVRALQMMGDPRNDWHIPTIAGLSREAGIALLDRAAEVGLLTPQGGGYYSIHPALPWFFRQLYADCHPEAAQRDARSAALPPATGHRPPDPTRAYVEAIGALGTYYHGQYEGGNRGVIGVLRAEEANLLHARRLALAHGWYGRVISAMQGLRKLYGHSGRRAEWRALVQEIAPHFIDQASDGPLAGREEQWGLVNQYRVRLLQEDRQWEEATRLQRLRVEFNLQQAVPLLQLPPEQLESGQRNSLRSLAVSVEQLGHLQREQGAAECVASYQEALEVFERIGARAEAAVIAFNLGRTYTELPALRDLAQAERWYRRSLELTPENDQLQRGKGLGQLGLVAYERFREARQAGQASEVLNEHWQAALKGYQEALAMTPPDAINEQAVYNNALGVIYDDGGHLDQAVAHYRESIRYFEAAGDLYKAAGTRANVAIAYAEAGRLKDALLFAQAALRGYQQFGPAAAGEAAKAQRTIDWIEGMMRDPATP